MVIRRPTGRARSQGGSSTFSPLASRRFRRRSQSVRATFIVVKSSGGLASRSSLDNLLAMDLIDSARLAGRPRRRGYQITERPSWSIRRA